MRTCKQPWYDPASSHDRKLILRDDPGDVIEVDSLEAVRQIPASWLATKAPVLVYQQWGAPAPDGSRAYYWLDGRTAGELGQLLKGGSVRGLILIVTMFEPGALRVLADVLESLEMLGLFWYFSGDDFTDDRAGNAADIGYAARRLGIRRLSILTGAFDASCEAALAEALDESPTLGRCAVFLKDDRHTWPQVPTPVLDRSLSNR